MKEGDKFLIVPSDELIEMRLMAIAFRHAVIKEVCTNSYGIYGAWAELFGAPYLNETEWFIPVESIHL